MTVATTEVTDNGNIRYFDEDTGKTVFEYDPQNGEVVTMAAVADDVVPSDDDTYKMGKVGNAWAQGVFSKTQVGAVEVGSDYTTGGEGTIVVDTSDGPVDLTFRSADIPASGEPARKVTIVNTGTDDFTIKTEGQETIEPGGLSSLTYSSDEVYVEVVLAKGSVYVDRNKEFKTTVTGQVDNDDYHEKVVTQSGSTGSLDLSAANVFEQTVTGNISFSFNNPSATPAGNSFLLVVIQDGTGGHTLSWPAAVEWDGGSAPGVSTAANDKHIFSFVSPDGGTTWYGFVAAENVA